MDGDRRRLRCSPNHGDYGHRRNAGRQCDRNLFRACDLLRGGEMVRRWQGACLWSIAGRASSGGGRLKWTIAETARRMNGGAAYEKTSAIRVRHVGFGFGPWMQSRPELPST